MIEVKGPNVFSGYWRMPEKTKAEFRDDGFFITGDLGLIDADGYVHIVGRGKDLIISGGYNIYPKEIESEIDALAGVSESAVIGVAHPDFGEGVTAVVVRAPASTDHRGRYHRRHRRAAGQIQAPEAGDLRRRIAAQHDGQGAEEPVCARPTRTSTRRKPARELSPLRTSQPARDQFGYNSPKTCSAMARLAVRPGLSMPNRLTIGPAPWSAGPWIMKSAAGWPGPDSFGLTPA